MTYFFASEKAKREFKQEAKEAITGLLILFAIGIAIGLLMRLYS